MTGEIRTTGSESWLSIEEMVSHGSQGWQKQGGGGGSPLQVAERECDRKEELKPEVSFKNSKREGLWRNSKWIFSAGHGELLWF